MRGDHVFESTCLRSSLGSLTGEASLESSATERETFRCDGYRSGFDDTRLVALAVDRDTSVQCQHTRLNFDDAVYRRILAQRYLEGPLGGIHGYGIAFDGLDGPVDPSTAESEIASAAESSAALTEPACLACELLAQPIKVWRCRAP